MTPSLILRDESIRQRAIDRIKALPIQEPPFAIYIAIYEALRTLEQSSKMFAMLDDVAEQVEWYGKKLGRYDWKDVFTSSLIKSNVVPNLEGTGFVACGLHTSKMSKRLMSELIELMFAFGAEKGVKWTDQG